MLDFGFYNMDCMDGMKEFPDKFFELAIVDPPYGIDAAKQRGGSGWVRREEKDWDKKIPDKSYFDELFRVSVNQIIFGGNYMTDFLRPSMGWIVWNKMQREFSLADGELAWTSFNRALRVFDYSRAEALQNNNGNGGRFHPTQKPIALYEWIVRNYVKPGDKILDTHVGSASSLIAYHRSELQYVGFEIDEDYYKAAKERLEREIAQVRLC